MLIAGDISGIQEYLFDVAHEGGAQARKLRARSFYLQLLAEIAALRIAEAAGWGTEQIVFCSAGKFLLHGDGLTDTQKARVEQERASFSRLLMSETGAQLRFALVISDETGIEGQQYENALKSLETNMRRAWAELAIRAGGWEPDRFVLAPLDAPCELCKRRAATGEENDPDSGNVWQVCDRCRQDREIGAQLPQSHYAVVTPGAQDKSFSVGGWHVRLTGSFPRQDEGYILPLGSENGARPANSRARILPRYLARHIPTQNGQAIEFVELAEGAKGAPWLGVLKMDGDALGAHFRRITQGATDLSRLAAFSKELDEFFAIHLSRIMSKSQSRIYTIFAGGDDLLMVGAWDEIFAFAGQIHQLFARQFGARHLTISGGLAFIRPKHPIRFAAARADELLETAKAYVLPNEAAAKDQLAAFGQVWKWRHHRIITDTANQLVGWVEAGAFQRGWLHTLLRLALLRHSGSSRAEKQLATSRLAHHVARNYPRGAVRDWADRLVEDFDRLTRPETFYLPAITRYALTATRSKGKEEDRRREE
ncbi:MAG TPA: type III-A CRISPR-associated protein Cas10/Csm1 [Blastocatellia bacterium]|nr:type III-A CRISPR-associated protein Cas10/Csm1 [Blastocatellia bacterium]